MSFGLYFRFWSYRTKACNDADMQLRDIVADATEFVTAL